VASHSTLETICYIVSEDLPGLEGFATLQPDNIQVMLHNLKTTL